MNYSHRLNNFIIYRMISHNIKNTVCNVTESIVLAKCDGRDLYFLLERAKNSGFVDILLQCDGRIETMVIYVNKKN